MSSDWDEIKRLAADFQKAQLTSTLQKLSEINCVEVVSLLIQKGLVEVVFTNDGKEYITPDHLERGILDELYVNGGRVNLVEISKSLNVDFTKIEHVASKIASDNKQIRLVLGQLIAEDYIVQVAHEINEKLAQKGEINVSDLTVQYDLPSEFLQNIMEKYLGKIIHGRQDASNPRTFFTQAYLQRCKSKMRGILAAVTRPTTVASIYQQIGIPENIFHSLLDEISPAGSVTTKHSNAQYVPNVYSKMQSDWVNSFYKQNSFLEYDAITKLGISDAKQFIKQYFPNEEMVYLKKCAVGSKIIDLTLVSALNECKATNSYVDLSTILPSNMYDEDIEELFQTTLSTRNIPNNFVYLENIVFSNQYLAEVLKPCQDLAMVNAKKSIESGFYQQHIAEKQASSKKNDGPETDYDLKADKRDERRKKGSSAKGGGGGGNTQGREIKTKSNKKPKHYGKSGGKEDIDSDNRQDSKSNKSLLLVKPEEMEKIIGKTLEEEGIDHLSGVITALYENEINDKAIQEAQRLFEMTSQTNRRQTLALLQEKINTLLVDIRLYEKGLKVFPVDVQSQILKYLMKTLGNDICQELTVYVANECNLNLKCANNLNIDQRNKIAQECDPEYKTPLIELNKALNKTIDEFVLATEEVLKACGMVIKKVDKKKDRILIVQHKEKLLQQLDETEDHAMVLHLTSLIVFITVTGCILHASGRFVSQILAYLRPNMSSEQNDLLMQSHDLVLKMLQLDSASDEYKTLSQQLNSIQGEIKGLAKSYTKPGVTKAD
ncbi:E3 UFM1-protein ligase 1 homolog [Episyrphus balteatus]|uniref:E3 UFM1-protein ligase 1 homolog n=1 Tax=Episyrphus balteatus TaxID=286459 RepID=UPI00248632A6|nr:E3 UFM1-protein ligase 1 homolog [Episyrphus balteatus]